MIEDILKIQQLTENRVIVRIWTSGANQTLKGKSVGHVSVEANQYMSLWPEDYTGFKGTFKPIEHALMASYENDLDNEDDRQPEAVFCFYTLDRQKITQAFIEVQRSLEGWALLGHLVCENSESCASLAYRLLQAGELDRIVSGKVQFQAKESSVAVQGSSTGFYKASKQTKDASSFAVTSKFNESQDTTIESSKASSYAIEMGIGKIVRSPDYLAALLQEIKRKELENEPLTQNISFEGETEIKPTEAKTTCLVM